jgi:hypothetical protein
VDEPDDIGKLLTHIEALQQIATCVRLGLDPTKDLLAKLRQAETWTEQIKASR